MNSKSTRQKRPAANDHIPVSEWIVSGIGLLLVLGSLAFLLYKAILVDPIPPSFAAQFVAATRSPNGFTAQVRVSNRGGETVADLLVEGRQQLSSEREVRRQVSIDYLPAHSSRDVYLILPELPDAQSLQFAFLSYKHP